MIYNQPASLLNEDILIVDDDPASRKVLADLLNRAGYKVRPASNGKLALRSVLAKLPTLILLDIRMPGMDGYEVCRQLKSDEKTCLIPVVFISALNDDHEKVMGFQAGGVDYITKPFRGEEVLARVNTHLSLRRIQSNLEEMVEARTRELKDAQEKLVRQERLALLGQLAGSVGHELRSPLGVIANAVYYLNMVQPDADKAYKNHTMVKQYLGIIEKEIRTAEKIITDLLDFSRIKSMDQEDVEVAALMRGVLERFPVPKNVTVTLNLPEDLPNIYIDPLQITQVLGNLVMNACQAMPEGGELTISAAPEDGNADADGRMPSNPRIHRIGISIQDTGVGIITENLSKLFEPLFTTKPRGIGLGLVVSKMLVEANNGRIEVQSEPGKGSTFTLYLPVLARNPGHE